MAGFSFDVPCSQAEKRLLGGILGALKRRAGKVEVEITYHFERSGASRYFVSIDGPLRSIQSFTAILVESELAMVFAEAFNEPASFQVRRQVAKRLTRKISEWTARVSVYNADVSNLFGGVPNSYFFACDEASELSYPLVSFSGILVLYHMGRVGTTPVVEAAHTAVEALLNTLTRNLRPTRGRFVWFPEKVEEARAKGYRDTSLEQHLKDFNQKRVDAKHNNQQINPEIIDPLLERVIEACHTLLRYVA